MIIQVLLIISVYFQQYIQCSSSQSGLCSDGIWTEEECSQLRECVWSDYQCQSRSCIDLKKNIFKNTELKFIENSSTSKDKIKISFNIELKNNQIIDPECDIQTSFKSQLGTKRDINLSQKEEFSINFQQQQLSFEFQQLHMGQYCKVYQYRYYCQFELNFLNENYVLGTWVFYFKSKWFQKNQGLDLKYQEKVSYKQGNSESFVESHISKDGQQSKILVFDSQWDNVFEQELQNQVLQRCFKLKLQQTKLIGPGVNSSQYAIIEREKSWVYGDRVGKTLHKIFRPIKQGEYILEMKSELEFVSESDFCRNSWILKSQNNVKRISITRVQVTVPEGKKKGQGSVKGTDKDYYYEKYKQGSGGKGNNNNDDDNNNKQNVIFFMGGIIGVILFGTIPFCIIKAIKNKKNNLKYKYQQEGIYGQNQQQQELDSLQEIQQTLRNNRGQQQQLQQQMMDFQSVYISRTVIQNKNFMSDEEMQKYRDIKRKMLKKRKLQQQQQQQKKDKEQLQQQSSDREDRRDKKRVDLGNEDQNSDIEEQRYVQQLNLPQRV